MRVRRTATTAAVAAMADTTPAPTPTVTTPTPAADCDALPAGVKGKPVGLAAGSRGGDYIWHDKDGWHLRVTHATDDKRVYTGVIHSTKPMTKEPVALEKTDSVKLSADRKTLTFSFANYGFIDGVDFTTDCSQAVTFALRAGGRHLDRTRVYLGAKKAHPRHVPFTIRRHEPKVTPTPTPLTTPAPVASS